MNTATNEKKVLAYIRVSTPMQVERGHSLQDQRRRLKEYVCEKLGADLPDGEIYTGEAISGTWTIRQLPLPGEPIRPKLSDLVDRCMEEEVHALVIDTIDRLGRDVFVCFGIQRLLRPHGVRVLVADGDLDFMDPDDELILGVRSVLDQAEVRKMSHRGKRAQRERRDAGYPPHGKMGFGWRWQTEEEFRASGQPFKGPVRVDEEADRVRWIFDQYLRRGRTLEDICAELNDRKVPFRDSDVAWQPSRLRRILGNWLHAGLNEGNDGELDRGAHFDQRIIDPDVYYAVQELRAKRSKRGPRALSQRDAPLLGVARCGMCGQRVQLQRDQRNQPLYVCPRPQEGESRTCDGFSKRADAVDKVVADFIRQIASAPRLRAMVREEATAQLGEGRERLQQRRASLEREMQALDDRLESWAVKLTDGVVGEEAFLRISQRWQADLATAEEELADVQRRLEHGDVEERRVRQVMDALDNFTDTWERLEAPAIRQLLLSMVEELTIEPGRDASVTVRLKCYYMPEMTARIPHLREAIGGDEPWLAKLTPTDLAFLALWAEGRSYREIEQARGLKKNVADSQAHRIRRRTGMDDLDEIAELARPLIEEHRLFLPTDRRSAKATNRPGLRPTDRQLQVARLIAEGLTYTEVANRLGPTPSTIRRHMHKLRERLEVETNEDAIATLVGEGLL
ncbi:MAG: recombinase family protein [Armatimonadota bacterium]|nr:recombinase family protein [Armatimonadota bacterium]